MAFVGARPMKALLDDTEFGGEPVLFACNAEPLRRQAGGDVLNPSYLFEAAGAAFSARYDCFGRPGKEGKKQRKAEVSDDSESDEGEEYGRSKGAKEKATGSFKVSDVLKGVKLYELLGVSEGASQEEIKKAYRGLALSAHPDKQVTSSASEAKKVQERFVQIQEAYELLSDPAKRMQYDSSLDFDDSLPKFKPDSGQDFFEVFGECFKRNARFSVRRPVPDLGGPDSSQQEWKRFYNFWFEFQSWRDPIVLAQKDGEELCDLNEAECREEKRWMMRENARVAKAYKQAERDRIAELVRLSEKYDPRVLAEKEAKRAEREAEAARRLEEKRAVQRAKEEAERKRREEEEAAKAAEAAKRREEKAAREAAKAEVKKCRQRLRSFHPAVKHLVVLDQLNEVCLQFEEQALRKLGDDVEKALKRDPAAAAALLHTAIESLGLTPLKEVVKVEDDVQSTSSGPSSNEDPQVLKEQERLRKLAEKKRAEEEAKKAEERAKLAAEKAEQKKVRDEQRRKEQAQAEATKKKLEKKEEEKARKAEERRQREEEQEAQKKLQQREEARQRSLEQAEKDRQAAAARREEQDAERVAQMFSTDRLEKLSKLDPMSEQDLAEALEKAVEEDPSLGAALQFMQECCSEEGAELMLDRAMALLSKAGPVWPLGLAAPATVRLPNAVRNRAKKARGRLRDVVTACLPKISQVGAGAELSEWQRGIADGSIEPPVWTPEEREAEERAAKQAKEQAGEAPPPSKKGKKAKEAKEPKGEEDLDELLAEFGVAPAPASKGKGGKKKK